MSKLKKQRPIRRALFTRLGKLFATRERNPSQLFLLFNHAVVGGADLVHVAIAKAVADANPWVFFTLPTWPQPFAERFPPHLKLDFIGRKCTSHARRFFQIGKLAALINAHEKPLVFASQSRLFFEVLPLLGPHVRCVDLMHALHTLEAFSLPWVGRVDQRVFISAAVMRSVQQLYRSENMDAELNERMCVVENCVDIPDDVADKPQGVPLQVIFVGRGAVEKRVHLSGRVATRCRREGINAEFTLVGDVKDWLEPGDEDSCALKGIVTDPTALDALYRRAHVLLLTSAFEGFPIVCMEAMARKVVPVCTDVGGIAEHVIPGETGVLLPANEDQVVDAAVFALRQLEADRGRCAALASAGRERAARLFGFERFRKQWRELLLGEHAHLP